MAKSVRRNFTREEKSAYVAEFERLYRAGGRTYASIARQLGLSESNYFAWVARGIKPSAPVATSAAPSSPRIAYSPDQRERLVAEVERLVASGQAVRAACRTAGIGEKSFRAWRAQRTAPLQMREVAVTALVPAPSAAPAAIAVVAPGGYRVEGLDVENVARLLRALAC